MTLEKMMKTAYTRNDFTRGHYIVGIHENGIVSALVLDDFHFVEMAKLDVASRGAGACLKYRQTRKAVETLRARASAVFTLCSVETLEKVAQAYGTRPNRGKAFEKLVTEYYGETWTDDNIPFWKDGDITLNGQAYQIKYDNCNFCNEKQVLGLRG